jgi:hypothetical protein
MDILERLGLLQGPGAIGAPLNRSSNQDRREGIVIIYSTSLYLTVENLRFIANQFLAAIETPRL